MEDNSDQFPEQDFVNIIQKIKKSGNQYKNMQDFAIDLIRKLDGAGKGFVPLSDFISGLKR
jgi:hypothetical protein